MLRIQSLCLFLGIIFSVPLNAMSKPDAPAAATIGVTITTVRNSSDRAVTILGSCADRSWKLEAGQKSSSLKLSLNKQHPDITILTKLGRVEIRLVGTELRVISSKSTKTFDALEFANTKITILENGFVKLEPISSLTSVSPATTIPAAPTPAAMPTSWTTPANKASYKTFADFILDANPRQPTDQEAKKFVIEYENVYIDVNNWANDLGIKYDDLRNEDGSPLTVQQRKTLVAYLKPKHSAHSDISLRMANNNFEVLGGGPQNPVWKYVHGYLRKVLKGKLQGL